MQGILNMQLGSATYWSALFSCIGLVFIFELALKHYSRLQ
jgi:hypothetical protein